MHRVGKVALSGLALGMALLVLAPPAGARVVVTADGHRIGLLPSPLSPQPLAAVPARAPRVTYGGGAVMLSTRLYLIFWGRRGSFPAAYEGPIIRWARGLAQDSGKATNEFSLASLYYRKYPHQHRAYISRDVFFGGVYFDRRRYPRNACVNPYERHGTCLTDLQLQIELARDITAHHWPVDRPRDPRHQYLLFTPSGVESCEDPTQTSCTFSTQNGYCAYHSSFTIGTGAVVYSNMPYESGCDNPEAPGGTDFDPDTDGTLDAGIHEVMESATDPLTSGSGWTDERGNEVGDECDRVLSSDPWGLPLGGDDGEEFNQLIAGRGYYTQQIWSIGTPWSPAARCAQRMGPTPVLSVQSYARPDVLVRFNGTKSYDLEDRIREYAWNYGDGSPWDTIDGPVGRHRYTQPGTYRVSLAVTDGSGAPDTSTATRQITVRP